MHTEFYLSRDEMIEAVKMWLRVHEEEIPRGEASLILTSCNDGMDFDYDPEKWATLFIKHHKGSSK